MSKFSILIPRTPMQEGSIAQLIPSNQKNNVFDLFQGKWIYKGREVFYSSHHAVFHGRKIETALKKIQKVLSKINELQDENVNQLMILKDLIRSKTGKYNVKHGSLYKAFSKSLYGDIHYYEARITQLIDQLISRIQNQTKIEPVIQLSTPVEIDQTLQPLKEVNPQEKKEGFISPFNYLLFIDDFAMRFLHPYITGEICLESDPPDRLPFITQLFNAIEKIENISLSHKQKIDFENSAIHSYVKASILGWRVYQLSINKKIPEPEELIPRDKYSPPPSIHKQINIKKNNDIFHAALTQAVKKDFPEQNLSSTKLAAVIRRTWTACDIKNDEIQKEVVAASKNSEVFYRIDKDHQLEIHSKSALLHYLNKENILFLRENHLTAEVVKDIENQHKEGMRQQLNRQKANY